LGNRALFGEQDQKGSVMSRLQHSWLASLCLVAVAALLAFPAGTLAAQPTTVHDAWDFTDTATDACGVPGLTVEEHFTGEIDGFFRFIDGRPFPYFLVHVSFFNTFTGPNGKVVTVSGSRLEKDARIVDNGDGTITISSNVTGSAFTVTGPNGERSLDRGLVTFQFTVDYNGTPANPDDDIFVSDQGVQKIAGPHPGLESDLVCEFGVPAWTS
jgi:hypothetical protein